MGRAYLCVCICQCQYVLVCVVGGEERYKIN